MDVETSLNVGAEISCWGYIPMASSDTMIFFGGKGIRGSRDLRRILGKAWNAPLVLCCCWALWRALSTVRLDAPSSWLWVYPGLELGVNFLTWKLARPTKKETTTTTTTRPEDLGKLFQRKAPITFRATFTTVLIFSKCWDPGTCKTGLVPLVI